MTDRRTRLILATLDFRRLEGQELPVLVALHFASSPGKDSGRYPIDHAVPNERVVDSPRTFAALQRSERESID